MFKVGDRVRIFKDHYDNWIGKVGTVKRSVNDTGLYYIEYDEDGWGQKSICYYTRSSCLELVSSKLTSHLPIWF